jgi:hypothetical protein
MAHGGEIAEQPAFAVRDEPPGIARPSGAQLVLY